jgi:hypothetical protein
MWTPTPLPNVSRTSERRTLPPAFRALTAVGGPSSQQSPSQPLSLSQSQQSASQGQASGPSQRPRLPMVPVHSTPAGLPLSRSMTSGFPLQSGAQASASQPAGSSFGGSSLLLM